MNYKYVESKYGVREVNINNETLWEVRKDGILMCSRMYNSQAQAFLALGILEMLDENREALDIAEFERLMVTNNLLITGKEW